MGRRLLGFSFWEGEGGFEVVEEVEWIEDDVGKGGRGGGGRDVEVGCNEEVEDRLVDDDLELKEEIEGEFKVEEISMSGV